MKVLIVDDEKLSRLNIINQLDSSFSIIEASSFEEGLRKIQNQQFDICYLDLKLDQSQELKGLKLIPECVKRGLYSVVMTSVEDEEVTEEAYELGCQDVYNKGHESAHISETLGRYFISKESFIEDRLFRDLVPTQNRIYKDDLKKLLKIIPTEIPVMLLGESGTGKSHLARTIHELSRRKGHFIELNCATFNGDTLKSELFGHTKGSFTGAHQDKSGKLAQAHNGTLFLDEIGSMSLEMQEGLLKAIEERSFYPLGSNKIVKSDFRIICATLDDLSILIKNGKFRFDLYQRMSGYAFQLPALRNRKEDIFSLLKSKLSTSRRIIFKEDAKREILNYSWPGNIRELFKFAEVISYSESGVIRSEQVRDFTHHSKPNETGKLLEDHHYSLIRQFGLKHFLDLISQEAVERSLIENQNQARKAIAELQISSATFYKLQANDRSPHLLIPKQEQCYELQ
ncbi:MAG: sigma-54-dependent transcriptional regulator [Bacteriovoracaceae bacterium]